MDKSNRSAALTPYSRSQRRLRKLLLASLATSIIVACGDDGDDDSRTNSAGSPSGGTAVGLPEPGTDFIISCVDEKVSDCVDYVADESGRADVEEVATNVCKLYVGRIAMEPCTRDRSVGVCVRRSRTDRVAYTTKTVAYPPITEEQMRLRCAQGGGKFEPGGG